MAAMIAMVVLSFANLFGLSIAGLSVVLGVVASFVNKAIEKGPDVDSGLGIKSIGAQLRNSGIWFWILLPMITDAVRIVISELFLPQYVEFEAARAGAFVPIELSVSSVLQFLVFALGEEIAWRAFFQRQLSNVWPVAPVLLISSLLFSIGHLSTGNPVVVVFGVSFVFINSVLYGVVYHKTESAWISTVSHFAANVFELVVMVLFLL